MSTQQRIARRELNQYLKEIKSDYWSQIVIYGEGIALQHINEYTPISIDINQAKQEIKNILGIK